MKILVISTPGDQIRKDNVLQQFAGQSTRYDYELVEAIMNPPQPCVGIMRSFKKCVTIAKENNWDHVCILEDDFKCLHKKSLEWFFEMFERKFDHQKEQIFDNALFLGGLYSGALGATLQFYREPIGIAQVKGKCSGLQAIIVPSTLYSAILEAEEPYQLDYWLSKIKPVPIYVMYPFGIIQNDGHSYNIGEKTNYNETLHLKYKLLDGKN